MIHFVQGFLCIYEVAHMHKRSSSMGFPFFGVPVQRVFFITYHGVNQLRFFTQFTTKTHTDRKTGGAQRGGLTKIKRLIMPRLILFLAC